MVTELVDKYDRHVNRFLEILPGFLTWTLLLSPIWLGLFFPRAIVYLLTFLSVYWVYLCIKHTVGILRGYYIYKKEKNVDWYSECKKLDFKNLPDKETLPSFLDNVKHFILIPVVNEPDEVLKDSLNSILNQTYPPKSVTLVYTIEEKYHKDVEKRITKLLEEDRDKLDLVLTYVHPAGIVGEAVGVGGANRTWGARHAVEDLNKMRKNIRNYIFSSLDADHVINPQYLARLTHLYLASDRRDNKFYSTAVHLFNNNLWRVPVIMRIEANAVTLGGLSDWATAARDTKDTFSSYSASLQTLIDADYWDVSLGVDDTLFYWRAFFARSGDFEGVCHYVPYSADAVEGANYINCYVSLYKQLLRWGWGVIDFPLSVKEFIRNKRIPLRSKISWIMKHLEKRVLLINIVFLITFGFGILTAVNPNVKQTSYAYSLPDIVSLLLTFTMFFIIPGTIIRIKLAEPFPEEWPIWKRFLAFLEGPMIIFNLLTFSFFPFVEAQTRMLFGRKMKDMYHTPKVR